MLVPIATFQNSTFDWTAWHWCSFGKAEVTLTLKAEEYNKLFGVRVRVAAMLPQISIFFRRESGKNRHIESNKNNTLKKSLITSQCPWFCLISCLFLLGGRVLRKTTLPATMKLDTQPTKIASNVCSIYLFPYLFILRVMLVCFDSTFVWSWNLGRQFFNYMHSNVFIYMNNLLRPFHCQ